MVEQGKNLHVLDAAYSPFPPFAAWVAAVTLDTARWERYKSLLKENRANASPDVLARARNIATRAAAIDTGAIEGLYQVDRGFTYTIALQTAAWETTLAEKGQNVRSLFEAQLHAYDYVLDLATKAEPVSEAAIRVLHKEVCRAQQTYFVITSIGPQEQPLPKGMYKTLPNHVRGRHGADHSYAPVDVTPSEMYRLVLELRSEEFLAADPVLQAAYAHYAFVVVHPFADGNGRVARALASAFTYRALSMPIVILAEHKDDYLRALESSDAGSYQEFVDFMLARCLDTIGLVNASLGAAGIYGAEESTAAIEKLYVTRGGYTHEQVDQAGQKLLQTIDGLVKDRFAKVETARIKASQRIVTGNYPAPTGYRLPLDGGKTLEFNVASLPPANARVSRNYNLLLPRDPAREDELRLVAMAENPVTKPDERIPPMSARIDELFPALSGVAQIRLRIFAERIVDEMLAELKRRAESALRGSQS